MKTLTPAALVLADGTVFRGCSIGALGQAVGEVVFNTSMTGYQEILTDPSYAQQLVTLTYPHIGNVGTTSEDAEANRVFAAGLIVREPPTLPSNWRSERSLGDFLRTQGVVAIAEIDTRRLTRIIRSQGAQNACLVAAQSLDIDAALELARQFPGLAGADLAKQVSTTQAYRWDSGTWKLGQGHRRASAAEYRVVAIDYGIKRNILRILTDLGCALTVLPAQTSAQTVLQHAPDGVFLSNGPGDPEPCAYAIDMIQELLDCGLPLFGICLGYQLLALAMGARTEKMKFGHHGANHPVASLDDGGVLITSQNHGFAVSEASLPRHLLATHRSLFDGSLQGIRHSEKPAFGFQGHPEASPGPHDLLSMFGDFIEAMRSAKRGVTDGKT